MKLFYSPVYVFSIAAVVLTTTSCSKIDLSPKSSLDAKEFVSDENAVYIMNGAYERLQNVEYYGRNFQVMNDVMGDDIKITSDNSGRFLGDFQYSFVGTSRAGNSDAGTSIGAGDTWSRAYGAIYQANVVINKLSDAASVLPYKGEAYFVRALAYFDLARRYTKPYFLEMPNNANTGLPLVLESAENPIEVKPSRSTMAELYGQIISDLKKAQTLAPKAIKGTSAISRGSQEAATALLSRVYLYMGEWDNSIREADKLIGQGFELWKPLDIQAGYLIGNSSEDIFSLRFTSTEGRGANDFSHMYTKDPGYGDIRVSDSFLSRLETGDARRSLFIDYAGGGTLLNKFSGIVDVKILRLSELYLNRAEAYAELGNLPAAKESLNTFRANRGLLEFNSNDLQTVKEEIQQQRRIEFIGEGHRVFDIFRKGKTRVIEDEDALKTTPIDPKVSHRVCYPIPVNERDANPNIVQNQGY